MRSAQTTALRSLKRWSIRDLIEFNLAGDSAAHNTRLLLEDVSIRLAVQLEKLSDFSKIEQYAKVSEVEGEKAMKNLKQLKQLHENTHSEIYQIIDCDGKAVLDNFSSVNQKYVSSLFDQIMARHGGSVETLADAVIHARNMQDGLPNILKRPFCEAELLKNETIESFLHSRLLTQLLCEHYVSLNKGKLTGAVSVGADVLDIIDDAVTESKHVCDANLGIAPEICIQPDQSIINDFSPPPLIRSWLHHAIVEVSKNAMTSNIQRHVMQQSSAGSIPPSVFIGIEKESVGELSSQGWLKIRIMDQGIGIKNKEEAFHFAQSSSQKRWDRLDEQQSYAAVRQPLGSLGVGLTISRLMMRVFGGDLHVSNEKQSGIDSGCTATLIINCDDTCIAKN